jgi:hypothetical protein
VFPSSIDSPGHGQSTEVLGMTKLLVDRSQDRQQMKVPIQNLGSITPYSCKIYCLIKIDELNLID